MTFDNRRTLIVTFRGFLVLRGRVRRRRISTEERFLSTHNGVDL